MFYALTAFSVSARQELQHVARITGSALGDDVTGKRNQIVIPTIPPQELENRLLRQAQQTYGYNIIMTNFNWSKREDPIEHSDDRVTTYYVYSMSADIYKYVTIPDQVVLQPTLAVLQPTNVQPSQPTKETPKVNEAMAIEKVVNKAMESISPNSRIAINTIVTGEGLNREQINDIILDTLLGSNYKVVAKEYLEKLKEEIEEQQSGDYNNRTTVKTDNFSAVGYFLDLKIRNNVARVYIVNVSTGEYVSTASQEFEK